MKQFILDYSIKTDINICQFIWQTEKGNQMSKYLLMKQVSLYYNEQKTLRGGIFTDFPYLQQVLSIPFCVLFSKYN